MSQCTDEDIGKLITRYELGVLTDKERTIFEIHLLECGCCLQEIKAMWPFISEMRENKAELLNELANEGISFKTIKERLFINSPRIKPIPLWIKISTFVDELVRPRILIPIGIVATVLLLFLIRPHTHHPESLSPQTLQYHEIKPLKVVNGPDTSLYLPLLSFDKIPYTETRPRPETEFPKWFKEGMEKYQRDDFKGAASDLQKSAEKMPGEGNVQLYLGISNYLARQPDPAIKALYAADSLVDPSMKGKIHWYLAQAHLMKGETGQAKALLEDIIRSTGEYSARAESLLSRVQKVKSRPK